ncbi:FUSC family protein [Paraburkholderia ferrariae]|uniref:FUSC family protein n=1 Tax=Paraburkholderia ferrariae TaxID=386056 RepID=UPI000A032442|nr:FUSC family protein [Paraburkholderia ferrariae]
MAHSEPDTAAAAPVAQAGRPRRRRSRVARVWRALASPYYRYRNARLIHSVRVGLAMLASIVATTGIDIPHGIWSSVTVLVVIGGLQHQGNIRKKAAERSLGTLLGAGIGLTLIVVQAFTHSLWLTYVLMSVVAGVCAWHAIGKPAYVALLTAITMCIVAGHGDNLIDTGLWRTLNVMIGIVIALVFSFALPLHATYSWRYSLADNLRECARLYARIVRGERVDADEQVRAFMRLNGRLVQLRALMPSVSKEIDVPLARLEQIQRLHRALLSALEMMSAGIERCEQEAVRLAFAQGGAGVREALLGTARALRFGGGRHPEAAAGALRKAVRSAAADEVANEAAGGAAPKVEEATQVQHGAPAARLPRPAASLLAPELQGPYWLGQRVEEQVEQLSALLLETEPRWNIERATLHPRV